MKIFFNLLPEFPKLFGTAREFREWEEELQRKYPLRYKINNIIEKIYRRVFLFPKWRLWDFKWSLYHRFHPKHRYTVHKIKSLPPGYYDPDTLIVHHSFDIFAEFMEFQLSGKSYTKWTNFEEDVEQGHMSQEEADEREAVWKTMNELYDWWTNFVPNEEQWLEENYPRPRLPREWGMLAAFDDKYRDTPEVKEWSEACKAKHEAERRLKEQETENFIRLVKIRDYLWY